VSPGWPKGSVKTEDFLIFRVFYVLESVYRKLRELLGSRQSDKNGRIFGIISGERPLPPDA
jgi:hypothetical protein